MYVYVWVSVRDCGLPPALFQVEFTDFPPASGVVLAFFPVSPSPTLPFARLVNTRTQDLKLPELPTLISVF